MEITSVSTYRGFYWQRNYVGVEPKPNSQEQYKEGGLFRGQAIDYNNNPVYKRRRQEYEAAKADRSNTNISHIKRKVLRAYSDINIGGK